MRKYRPYWASIGVLSKYRRYLQLSVTKSMSPNMPISNIGIIYNTVIDLMAIHSPCQNVTACPNFLKMVTMKLRHPYTTASIWSSGKVTCTGANSEEQVPMALCLLHHQTDKVSFSECSKRLL